MNYPQAFPFLFQFPNFPLEPFMSLGQKVPFVLQFPNLITESLILLLFGCAIFQQPL